jgi:hypothetical protein
MVDDGANVVVVRVEKNPGLAAGLALFFGPLGMLYSTVVGALVMFFVTLVVGIVTLGFGLILVFPGCAFWAYSAAARYNRELHRASRPTRVQVEQSEDARGLAR